MTPRCLKSRLAPPMIAVAVLALMAYWTGYFLLGRARQITGPKTMHVQRVFPNERLCALYAPAAFLEAKTRGAVVWIGSPGEIDWYARYE